MHPRDYQLDAIAKLKSGSILCGGVGTGKTFTSLFYYLFHQYTRKLYVITTAKKRDSKDWENEAHEAGVPSITVDSWNNIEKYSSIKDSFFIFDEQKIVSYGKWAKAFIKIAKHNTWIILSATPGDTWMDYLSIFIANGFYKNKTEFIARHVEYDPFVSYPKIKRYHEEDVLYRLRESITITMTGEKKTVRNRRYIRANYDKEKYIYCIQNNWNPFKDDLCDTASEMCQVLRKIINSSEDRKSKALDVINANDKLIIFYNYDYELEILENLCQEIGREYTQWNGHKHQEILKDNDKWIYLVHYSSSEGWNCIETNTILFYSLNYSWKITEQAEGRIDRMNTSFTNLYYYYLVSNSTMDERIKAALNRKGKFNELNWVKKYVKSI